MIKIIIGRKGSGKTKKLVDLVNEAANTSLGNVVCIEKGDTLTYSVTHKARLIDADAYGISGYNEYYSMLAGIVFDGKKKRHTKKVLLDNGLDARHKKFYLAYLISKMLLSQGKSEHAVVISPNSKLGENTVSLTKKILGSEIEIDDIIEEHNPTIKPRQYIRLDMNKKAN